MAKCIHCGNPVGFLRNKHADCVQKYEEGKKDIVAMISQAISTPTLLETVSNQINEICYKSYIPDSERHGLLVDGWSSAVDCCLDDSIIDEAEEKQLLELRDRLSLSREELDKNGSFSRVVKATVIRDLLNGIIPQRVEIDGSFPINFQKSEQIIWAFPSVAYLEDKTRRQYVGGSQGVSIRVMKGVYYRVGAFKGHAIDRTERVQVDTGWLVITNKNIYFAGVTKSMRISYAKVISFQSFSDGVGLIRDAANAKPQIFVTGDGWFTYNLVTNLAKL